MVLNPDKCHFMALGFQDQNFHYKNVVIRNSTEENVPGITIDNKLNVISHIINICTVANQKLALHKKRSFPLRISSVNMAKSTVFCGFGHIY